MCLRDRTATGKAVLLNAHYDSTPVGPERPTTASASRRCSRSDPFSRTSRSGVRSSCCSTKAKSSASSAPAPSSPTRSAATSTASSTSRRAACAGRSTCSRPAGPTAPRSPSSPRAVKHPVANSLSTDVYRLLPNYTDVNSFAERGWLTLNLAPIGNETRYHSPGDDVAALDPATLQHMGDQTLALTSGARERHREQRRRPHLHGRGGADADHAADDLRGRPADWLALRLREQSHGRAAN